jgi:hypothetical protein
MFMWAFTVSLLGIFGCTSTTGWPRTRKLKQADAQNRTPLLALPILVAVSLEV